MSTFARLNAFASKPAPTGKRIPMWERAVSGCTRFLWRGSLLPLECAALPKGAAAQPGASKLARLR